MSAPFASDSEGPFILSTRKYNRYSHIELWRHVSSLLLSFRTAVAAAHMQIFTQNPSSDSDSPKCAITRALRSAHNARLARSSVLSSLCGFLRVGEIHGEWGERKRSGFTLTPAAPRRATNHQCRGCQLKSVGEMVYWCLDSDATQQMLETTYFIKYPLIWVLESVVCRQILSFHSEYYTIAL